MRRPKIVFFGNERLATGVATEVPTLRGLIDAGFSISAVVANYETGLSRSPRKLEIEGVAKEHDIPLLLPESPSRILDQLKGYGASLGVLVAYGKIIPQSVIDIFPFGIINIHPSLLPLHRGPTPIESVILNGDKRTGVSLMKLVKSMDAGPVYSQREMLLTGKENKQELADALLAMGASMLVQTLPAVLDGSTKALPQDESKATYDNLITKNDGIIDWSKPAIRIEREIRAYLGWPKSRTKFAGKDVVVTKATVKDISGVPGSILIQDKGLIVYCGQQALKIDCLKPAGKQEMTAQAFLAGHKHLL